MPLREDLHRIVEGLIAGSEATKAISLDEIGEALGTTLASSDEIEAMFVALEAAGRSVVSPPGGDVRGRLQIVLAAARELRARTGRKPTPAELAAATGLDESAVRAALMLGSVMGR